MEFEDHSHNNVEFYISDEEHFGILMKGLVQLVSVPFSLIVFVVYAFMPGFHKIQVSFEILKKSTFQTTGYFRIN